MMNKIIFITLDYIKSFSKGIKWHRILMVGENGRLGVLMDYVKTSLTKENYYSMSSCQFKYFRISSVMVINAKNDNSSNQSRRLSLELSSAMLCSLFCAA